MPSGCSPAFWSVLFSFRQTVLRGKRLSQESTIWKARLVRDSGECFFDEIKDRMVQFQGRKAFYCTGEQKKCIFYLLVENFDFTRVLFFSVLVSSSRVFQIPTNVFFFSSPRENSIDLLLLLQNRNNFVNVQNT